MSHHVSVENPTRILWKSSHVVFVTKLSLQPFKYTHPRSWAYGLTRILLSLDYSLHLTIRKPSLYTSSWYNCPCSLAYLVPFHFSHNSQSKRQQTHCVPICLKQIFVLNSRRKVDWPLHDLAWCILSSDTAYLTNPQPHWGVVAPQMHQPPISLHFSSSPPRYSSHAFPLALLLHPRPALLSSHHTLIVFRSQSFNCSCTIIWATVGSVFLYLMGQ